MYYIILLNIISYYIVL